MNYRLIVGERGNEQGHVIPLKTKSLLQAKRELGRELKKYGPDMGWGRIEEQPHEGDWWRPVKWGVAK